MCSPRSRCEVDCCICLGDGVTAVGLGREGMEALRIRCSCRCSEEEDDDDSCGTASEVRRFCELGVAAVAEALVFCSREDVGVIACSALVVQAPNISRKACSMEAAARAGDILSAVVAVSPFSSAFSFASKEVEEEDEEDMTASSMFRIHSRAEDWSFSRAMAIELED